MPHKHLRDASSLRRVPQNGPSQIVYVHSRTQMFLHNNSWCSFDININDIEIKKLQKMLCHQLKGFDITNFIPIKMVGWRLKRLETSQQKYLGNFSVLLFCQEFSERMRDSFICMTIAFQSVSDKRPL